MSTRFASLVGNMIAPPMTWRCIGCRSNSNDVTTPKLPPPPRVPQKSSGFSSALACTMSPLAVTMSTLRTLSSARPKRRATRPKPPPSVRPPTPVCETVPAVVTRPYAIVSLSMSPSRLPPATRAIFVFGSTRTLRISDRSIIMPLSQVDLPDGLWPPHFTATSRLFARAKSTACFTSAAPRGCTISAGCLFICALITRRASSYAGCPGRSRLPRRLSPSSCTIARVSVTGLPAPVIASRSRSTFGVGPEDRAERAVQRQ